MFAPPRRMKIFSCGVLAVAIALPVSAAGQTAPAQPEQPPPEQPPPEQPPPEHTPHPPGEAGDEPYAAEEAEATDTSASKLVIYGFIMTDTGVAFGDINDPLWFD